MSHCLNAIQTEITAKNRSTTASDWHSATFNAGIEDTWKPKAIAKLNPATNRTLRNELSKSIRPKKYWPMGIRTSARRPMAPDDSLKVVYLFSDKRANEQHINQAKIPLSWYNDSQGWVRLG